MKVIGLTGGIGSGKSTVSSYLAGRGYPVIDADRMSHELTAKGSPCLARIAEAFGKDILTEEGELDRKKLGAIVFSDRGKKEVLESLTTDVVVKKITAEVQRLRREEGFPLLFLDVPLLFETGLDRITDAVWLVTAAEEVRIRRVRERDGLSDTEVKKRIENQMDTEAKMNRADKVIDNSKGKEELYLEIEQLLAEYAG